MLSMPVFLHSVILGIRRFCRLHVGRRNKDAVIRGKQQWAQCHRQAHAEPATDMGFGKAKKHAKAPPCADDQRHWLNAIGKHRHDHQRTWAPARPESMQRRRHPRQQEFGSVPVAKASAASEAWHRSTTQAECKFVVSRGKQPPASIGRPVLHRETANKHTSPNACWPAVAALRLSSKRRAVLNVRQRTQQLRLRGTTEPPWLPISAFAGRERLLSRGQAWRTFRA